MGWYNRRPRIKEPPKETPYHFSPMTEQKMKEAKATGPTKEVTEKQKK